MISLPVSYLAIQLRETGLVAVMYLVLFSTRLWAWVWFCWVFFSYFLLHRALLSQCTVLYITAGDEQPQPEL